MRAQERTRDIYEALPGYPPPPLAPLPDPDDFTPFVDMGIQPSRLARWIVNAALAATGFRAFQRQLPHTVESLLRRCDVRGGALFAPVISATLALQDDPRGLSPVERAATLIGAARELHGDIVSGRLAPDRHGGQVLEMGQYANLFATSLIVDGQRARLFKSTNTAYITVVVAGQFYILEIEQGGTACTVQQLAAALDQLAQAAHRNPRLADEPAPGLLTCAEHLTQIKAFSRLQKIPVNAESLSLLRHSFLTVCLDLESRPASEAEAAFMAHSGNCGNRWFHSSLQLVVFGNGKACVLCNFNAYVDGNPMMRAAAELQKQARAVSPAPDGTSAAAPSFTKLKWQISPELIQPAHHDLRAIQDNQPATFEFPGFGRQFFTARGVEPIPAVMLALQLAAKRLIGRPAPITQFLAMSKYRCADLVTAVITTPEVLRFVDYLEAGDGQPEQARQLLNAAIASQIQASRRARRHLPLDDIFSLFLLSRTRLQRSYVLAIATPAIVALRLLGLLKPVGRAILVSHPEIYPEVPVVGRPGVRLPYVQYFGLHYQVLEDRTVITLMPAVTWTIPNAQVAAAFNEGLERLREILQNAHSEPQRA